MNRSDYAINSDEGEIKSDRRSIADRETSIFRFPLMDDTETRAAFS